MIYKLNYKQKCYYKINFLSELNEIPLNIVEILVFIIFTLLNHHCIVVQFKLGGPDFFNKFAIGILSFRKFCMQDKKKKSLDLTSVKQFQIKIIGNWNNDED
jgi:hypothetical protein